MTCGPQRDGRAIKQRLVGKGRQNFGMVRPRRLGCSGHSFSLTSSFEGGIYSIKKRLKNIIQGW